MAIHFGGWGVGSWLLLFFVILPSIRWSIWGARWGMRYGLRHGPRWGRQYARRWHAGWEGEEDASPDQAGLKEIESLRADIDGRLAEVDSLQSRVAELENRLDFTERLLAQRAEGAAISEPGA
jgi:hypothetical protein